MAIIRRLGDSVDASFSQWSPILRLITEVYPPFLTILAEEMMVDLTMSDPDSSGSSAVHEAIYMWLDHILQSKEWGSTRRLLSPAYILATFDEAPSYWSKLLKDGGSLGKELGNEQFSAAARRGLQKDQPGANCDGSSPLVREEDIAVLEENGWHIS